MFEPMCELLPTTPPAIVVEDEAAKYQRLVEQGKEAAALETEGKHANVEWVQALKKAYPDVPQTNQYGARCGNLMKTHPEVFRIIMEARQCTLKSAQNFINDYKNTERGVAARSEGARARARHIRDAAIELVDSYRLGADPKACMEALAKTIEATRG